MFFSLLNENLNLFPWYFNYIFEFYYENSENVIIFLGFLSGKIKYYAIMELFKD